MSQSTGLNQRRFERFNIFERASLIDESGNSTTVILVDVSLGGAQVLARTPFPDGTPFKLQVGTGDDRACLNGCIRYNKPGEYDLTAVGFKLAASTNEERVAIANLVNRIFMNPTDAPDRPEKLIDSWLGSQAA